MQQKLKSPDSPQKTLIDIEMSTLRPLLDAKVAEVVEASLWVVGNDCYDLGRQALRPSARADFVLAEYLERNRT